MCGHVSRRSRAAVTDLCACSWQCRTHHSILQQQSAGRTFTRQQQPTARKCHCICTHTITSWRTHAHTFMPIVCPIGSEPPCLSSTCRYGVGGLSIINACAGCYSEDLPVVFVSGEETPAQQTAHRLSGLAVLANACTLRLPPCTLRRTRSIAAGLKVSVTAGYSSPEETKCPWPTCWLAVAAQVAPTPTTRPATTPCTTPSGNQTWASSTGPSRRSPATQPLCSTSQRRTTRLTRRSQRHWCVFLILQLLAAVTQHMHV